MAFHFFLKGPEVQETTPNSVRHDNWKVIPKVRAKLTPFVVLSANIVNENNGCFATVSEATRSKFDNRSVVAAPGGRLAARVLVFYSGCVDGVSCMDCDGHSQDLLQKLPKDAGKREGESKLH